MTATEWLAVILPGLTLDQGAVSALSSECARLYDLDAAGHFGYDTERLTALYVAANLAPPLVDGITGNIRTVTSRREGKVSMTYTKESQKAGWEGTTWGQEFSDAMGDVVGGGAVVGHAS